MVSLQIAGSFILLFIFIFNKEIQCASINKYAVDDLVESDDHHVISYWDKQDASADIKNHFYSGEDSGEENSTDKIPKAQALQQTTVHVAERSEETNDDGENDVSGSDGYVIKFTSENKRSDGSASGLGDENNDDDTITKREGRYSDANGARNFFHTEPYTDFGWPRGQRFFDDDNADGNTEREGKYSDANGVRNSFPTDPTAYSYQRSSANGDADGNTKREGRYSDANGARNFFPTDPTDFDRSWRQRSFDDDDAGGNTEREGRYSDANGVRNSFPTNPTDYLQHESSADGTTKPEEKYSNRLLASKSIGENDDGLHSTHENEEEKHLVGVDSSDNSEASGRDDGLHVPTNDGHGVKFPRKADKHHNPCNGGPCLTLRVTNEFPHYFIHSIHPGRFGFPGLKKL